VVKRYVHGNGPRTACGLRCEAEIYASGSGRFEKIVRFDTVNRVNAGLLFKHKGT